MGLDMNGTRALATRRRYDILNASHSIGIEKSVPVFTVDINGIHGVVENAGRRRGASDRIANTVTRNNPTLEDAIIVG